MTAARRRRWLHHGALALGAAVMFVLTLGLRPWENTVDQLSIATAYVCLLYMAAALVVGPLNFRRTGQPLLNNYLRRDIGIWSALGGLGHFLIAMDVSMSQAYLADYVAIDDAFLLPEARMQLFTWGTIAGLVIAVLLLLLLVLSNDRVLRRLGSRWWKRLQRSAYLAFALTVAHGLAFQVLEARGGVLIALVVVITAAVLGLQLAGALARRHSE